MIPRRHALPKAHLPRGASLAFLAWVIQVLVPFFLMVEIAHAEGPDGVAVICSALGHTPQNGKASDRGLADHCPICTALATAHGFAPPAAPPLPLPVSIGHSDLSAAEFAQTSLLVTSSYQSRGPPSIA